MEKLYSHEKKIQFGKKSKSCNVSVNVCVSVACVHLVVWLAVSGLICNKKMSQAPSNRQSMLADEEQWSDGSDSYVLASDDDPYGHYEVVSSDSEYETGDDLLDLATEIYTVPLVVSEKLYSHE